LFTKTIRPGCIDSIFTSGSVADVAVGTDGSVYENSTNILRRWNPTTGAATNLAGNGSIGKAGDGGLATSSTVTAGQTIVISPDNKFVLFPQFDNSYANIRCVNLTDSAITVAGRTINARCIDTIAGSSTAIGSYGAPSTGNGGPATGGRFRNARGMAISPDGKVMYIADADANCIRAVNLSNTAVTVFTKNIAAGNIETVVFSDAMPFSPMSALRAVDVDLLGNLYLSDQLGCTLRRVDAITNDMTIISGKYAIGTNSNSIPTVVQQPNGVPASQGIWGGIRGVAFDSKNNIYCADSGNQAPNVIRKMY
jgi:hypothetical protein